MILLNTASSSTVGMILVYTIIFVVVIIFFGYKLIKKLVKKTISFTVNEIYKHKEINKDR